MIFLKKEILKRYQRQPVSDSSSLCTDFREADGAVKEWWRSSAYTKSTPPPKSCSICCSTLDNYPEAFSSSSFLSKLADEDFNPDLGFFQPELQFKNKEMELICQKNEETQMKNQIQFPPFYGSKISEIQGTVRKNMYKLEKLHFSAIFRLLSYKSKIISIFYSTFSYSGAVTDNFSVWWFNADSSRTGPSSWKPETQSRALELSYVRKTLS